MADNKNSSSKNSTYVPIATPSVTHKQAEGNTHLPRDPMNKDRKAWTQSGSNHEQNEAKLSTGETYRIIRR
jgi:hypothetical protein